MNNTTAFRATGICLLLLALAAISAGGCGPSGSSFPDEPLASSTFTKRIFTAEEVEGPLNADRVRDLYGAADFVYAEFEQESAIVRMNTYATSSALQIDDTRLIVYVGGSGDSPDGFYHTAKLIAGSPSVWIHDRRPLLIVTLHWSESRDPIAEHTNLAAQQGGSQLLQQMCQVHDLRHRQDEGAHLSIMAFSAGSRVVQLAYGCVIESGNGTAVPGHEYPEDMNRVGNIVFLGSSLPRDDPLPFENISGRFINFVNPRDTHFGDRAAHVAPPGVAPSLPRLLTSRVTNRSPGIGASANGFDEIATLVSPEQFEAADDTEAGKQAFRLVNVRVPEQLVAYGLFGIRLNKDDLDDFINAAPNHYIMVGRGPGGAVEGVMFEQYREVAEEFVQFLVAPALISGQVPQMVLFSEPKPRKLVRSRLRGQRPYSVAGRHRHPAREVRQLL